MGPPRLLILSLLLLLLLSIADQTRKPPVFLSSHKANIFFGVVSKSVNSGFIIFHTSLQ